MAFNRAQFNQDATCLILSTDSGFKVYNTDPFSFTCSRDLRDKSGNGILLAEMLYRCNILALIGKDVVDDVDTTNDEFISPWINNVVTLWDDKICNEVAQLIFDDSICNVKLLHGLMVITLSSKLYLYELTKVTLYDTLYTFYNPGGLCSVASSELYNIVAYPGLERGTVCIQMYKGIKEVDTHESNMKMILIIKSHKSRITSINLNPNGSLVATSSISGSMIRLFNTVTGVLVQEFKKCKSHGIVEYCEITRDTKLLCAISSKTYANIYKINNNLHFNKIKRGSASICRESLDCDIYHNHKIQNRCLGNGIVRNILRRAKCCFTCTRIASTFR